MNLTRRVSARDQAVAADRYRAAVLAKPGVFTRLCRETYRSGSRSALSCWACFGPSAAEGSVVSKSAADALVPISSGSTLAAIATAAGVGLYDVVDGGTECVGEFGREMILRHGMDDNFIVMDLGRLSRLHQAFVEAMPRVRPFYAAKCNPDPVLLRVLAALGCGFDCASPRDIHAALRAGAAPEDIILASTCKRPADVRAAISHGVQLMTFDSEDEVAKLAEQCPNAHLVLRIRADDPTSELPFGDKFGVDALRQAPVLLRAAKRHGMHVAGVAFHIGSASHDPAAHRRGISLARGVFDVAEELGVRPCVLDIGGGFSAAAAGRAEISDVGRGINAALDEFFPAAEWPELRVIAEPGRYYAEAVATLFSLVTSVKRDMNGAWQYFITDGLYGSFALAGSGRVPVKARILRSPTLPPLPPAVSTAHLEPATIYGPSLDGADRLMHNVRMPRLRRGDWLQFPQHGAYSTAMASTFNGMTIDGAEVLYVRSQGEVGDAEAAPVVLCEGSNPGGAMGAARDNGKAACVEGPLAERRLMLVGQPCLRKL